MKNIILLAGILTSSSLLAQADAIADWNFDSLTTGTLGPIAADSGNGSASAFGISPTATAGNPGQAYSGSQWNPNDYYQFQVSTVGFENITVSYDQEGSGTGPGTFILEYSLTGNNGDFTQFGSDYSLGSTASVWTSHPADLSSVTILNDASTVYFRVVDNSATAINGNPVGTTGTDRIDNFVVNGTVLTPVPEPSTIVLASFGGLAGLLALRRNRAI